MDLGKPGQGASADNLSEATSEDSGTSLQIVADEPMPEASLTSKGSREPEDNEHIEQKSNKKKFKKADKVDTDEFNHCVAHLREIVEELESSNFTNIREVLGIYSTLEAERAVGTM